MDAKLIVVGGKANKDAVQLNLPSVVGRSREADLTVAHPMISRRHCELFEAEGVLMIRDLGSLNGTYVGHRRITEAPLKPEEEFTIGPLTFRAVYEFLGDASVFEQWQEGEAGAASPAAPREEVPGEAPTPQQAMPGPPPPAEETLQVEEAAEPAQEAQAEEFLSWLSAQEGGAPAGEPAAAKAEGSPWEPSASEPSSDQDPLSEAPTFDSPAAAPVEEDVEVEPSPPPLASADSPQGRAPSGARASAPDQPEEAPPSVQPAERPGAEAELAQEDESEPVAEPGASAAEIAFGELGSDEPTFELDLDLDLDNEIEEKEARRPVFGPGEIVFPSARNAFPDAGSVDESGASDGKGTGGWWSGTGPAGENTHDSEPASPPADTDHEGIETEDADQQRSDASSASSDRS